MGQYPLLNKKETLHGGCSGFHCSWDWEATGTSSLVLQGHQYQNLTAAINLDIEKIKSKNKQKQKQKRED